MDTIDRLKSYGLFDAHVPRFTSYPPANRFTDTIGPSETASWLSAVPSGSALSLYVHIPFCRRLCWFCACRTQGTRTDKPLAGYVDTLIREISEVRGHLPQEIRISRLHLGGGTPTILPSEQMHRLLDALDRSFGLSGLDEFSVEIDPTEYDRTRLKVLTDWGLSRASLGVQDFDTRVQQAIGRTQTPDQTRAAVEMLGELGVEALNLDLLYGLPFQTQASLARTLDQVLELGPSRLALYGYAHVPWASKRQVVIPVEALPDPETRFRLAAFAADRLTSAGMQPIGMDHFARPGDALAIAANEGRLARNFQGYTDDRVPCLIGLGASAISRFPQGYAQNEAATAPYKRMIAGGGLATARGYTLSPADRVRAHLIEQLMCYGAIRFGGASTHGSQSVAIAQGLIARFPEIFNVSGTTMMVEPWALPLVRILAAHVAGLEPETMTYSAAV